MTVGGGWDVGDDWDVWDGGGIMSAGRGRPAIRTGGGAFVGASPSTRSGGVLVLSPSTITGGSLVVVVSPLTDPGGSFVEDGGLVPPLEDAERQREDAQRTVERARPDPFRVKTLKLVAEAVGREGTPASDAARDAHRTGPSGK